MFCDPLPLQLLSNNHLFSIFWNGVSLPPSYLDNVFKYTVFFFRAPLRCLESRKGGGATAHSNRGYLVRKFKEKDRLGVWLAGCLSIQDGDKCSNRGRTPNMKMCSDFHQRVGTLRMKMCSDVHHRVGTPHMKMRSDVQQRVGTPHMKMCSDVQIGWGHHKWEYVQMFIKA